MPTPSGFPTSQDLINAQKDVEHLGRVVNSEDAQGNPIASSTNRTGGTNKTLDALQAEYQSAIQAAGGVPLGTWSAGVTYNAYNEYLVYNGVPYKPAASTPLPYTTQGSDPTVAPDAGNVVPFAEVQASDLEKFTIFVGDLGEFESLSLDVGSNVYLTQDGRSGEFVVMAGTPPSDPQKGVYIPLANGNYAERIEKTPINVQWYGITPHATADENYTALQQIARNDGLPRADLYFPPGVYKFHTFNPNNCYIKAVGVTLEFEHKAGTSEVMAQLTNCHIVGATFQSLETDLENQRTTGEHSTFRSCKFVGWRNPTNGNAWGFYVKDQDHNRLIDCEFDDNTQSDIALVDNASNIEILSCRGTNGTFAVNCEPNSSASENRNIAIKNCDISSLTVLEAGSGGTANKSIFVESCSIEKLVYDGASVIFDNCDIKSFGTETEIFFGKSIYRNTLNLTPNMVKDPFFFTFSFNQSQATSERNAWVINSKSTSGDPISFGAEDGKRYTRVNPNDEPAVANFILSVDYTIPVFSGEYLLIAITGRSLSGTSAAYLQVSDGVSEIDCRLFRQSNTNESKNFITEFAVLPILADFGFSPKIGKYSSDGGIVDIVAVSVHKILSGTGGNEVEVLQAIHGNNGSREILLSDVPTPSTVTYLNGYQKGDIVIPDNGDVSMWSGSSFVPIY